MKLNRRRLTRATTWKRAERLVKKIALKRVKRLHLDQLVQDGQLRDEAKSLRERFAQCDQKAATGRVLRKNGL